MISNQIVLRVIEALDHAGIPHMLVGSYSSNAYGITRSTQDADFVIELRDRPFSEIAELLGADFRVVPQSVLEFNTFTTRYILQHVESAFKVELFLLSEDAHDQERFRKRVRVPFLGSQAWMPIAEDVVVMKLRWAHRAKRAKDREDAYNILCVQKDHLDLPYIRRWCEQHETLALLEDLLAKVP